MTTSMIKVLKERKFRQVVCIDDDQAIPKLNSIETFADALVDIKPRKRRNLVSAHQEFEAVCQAAEEGDDMESKKSAVRALLYELEQQDKLSGDLISKASEILYQGHSGKTSKVLKEIFKDDEVQFNAYSFGQWVEQGDNVLAQASAESRLLILVDEKNENEPEVNIDGQHLLAEVFSNHAECSRFIDAIVVTSNCAPESELSESHTVYLDIKKLLEEKGCDQSFKKVFVLAKDRLVHQNLDKSFLLHLDRIEASGLSIELANITQDALINALKESLGWLKEIPLVEFHNSVFESASNEGAAEIDTLVRLASIRQREALEKSLKDNQRVRMCIEKMRQFSVNGLGGTVPSTDGSVLKELRSQEFERPKEHINILKAPLACGDVFELKLTNAKGEPKTLTAMLLANPCDLVLRKDGTRKLNTGLFVQVKKLTNQEVDNILKALKGNHPLYYKLATGSMDSDIAYLFYNSSLEAIPLDILDLCWLNSSGLTEYQPQFVQDTYGSLTPPQQQRLNILCNRIGENRFINIELWESELKLETGIANPPADAAAMKVTGTVKYPITRVWRLAPEYASAVLSTLAQSLARPVFGHDYLKH